ncbi:hypothetical protein SODALDRAFT_334861 [Sodiomyces alkalinus F11]|uniref:Uncharacterized protein n=1 Tax=Sodiomyces alkalinus (strain CBS 110278 / VKM F-3762 / F11) TaxID=1314773 RepID=A0A3N2PTA1_SODAK|nr:hypothetical protein SODALDRAFT_334861 [Sodiomyces alkalinus F11]ROT37730.1 hypothetical protein SODALDRAFT_334861 [Sodiomyces alkalinus F11]
MARLYAFQMGDMGNFSDSDYRYHHCDENNYQPEVANSSGPMSPVSSPHVSLTITDLPRLFELPFPQRCLFCEGEDGRTECALTVASLSLRQHSIQTRMP